MHRWHLVQWRGWQLALHRIFRSDEDRALHDHRSHNVSLILWGWYWEVLSHAWQTARVKLRIPFVPYFRKAEMPHRLVLTRPTWTLWLRWPPTREWGFTCRKGWIHWKRFVAEPDYSKPGSTSTVGPGCDG